MYLAHTLPSPPLPLSPLSLLPRSAVDRLSTEEASLAASLEREGMHNPIVLHCLNALSRRIRPSQLTIHRRLLKSHLGAIDGVVTEVASTALKTTRDGPADAAAADLSHGIATAPATARR